jgi:hypothetical protein
VVKIATFAKPETVIGKCSATQKVKVFRTPKEKTSQFKMTFFN